MATKKEKLMEKLLKKDYNNDLEEILAGKNFDEEVKNLLLDMLYKIEMSYKDYETVKKNTVPKDRYIQNIISGIKEKCDNISFMSIDDEEKEAFIVDKENRKIRCYPMTIKLLYAIAKIQKSEDIIKEEPEFLNKAISNILNTGNNINMLEPLRDFNGYAWSISISEFEDFYYNIIYQDLIILIENNLLEEWTNKNDSLIDYLELFKDKLEKEYGEKFQKEIIEILKNLSILLEIRNNKFFAEKIKEEKEAVETELKDRKNKEKYLEELTKHKKSLTKKIKEYDLLLNDPEKLAIEYVKRNKDLPLEQKIFSKRILKSILTEEREKMLEDLKFTADKMNTKTFIQRNKQLEYELQYLNLVETPNIEKEILDNIILLQKRVLQALKIKIRHTTTREELNKIIYEIRYLKLIPISATKNLAQVSKLNSMFATIEGLAIDRAYELRDLNEIFKYKDMTFGVLKNIFELDVIRLESLSLKILKEKDGNYVQFFDDGIVDKKIKLDFEFEKEDLRIKLNKKIKLFDI